MEFDDNAQRVQRFLASHPHLSLLVDEARSHIAKWFPEAPVRLVLETDPESSCQDEELVMLIGTTSIAEAALAALKRFDAEWWLDKVAQTGGKLVINIEFQ